jgi:hypothetical protein
MHMMSNLTVKTGRAQFDEFLQAKLDKGLRDTKFFVANVSESTVESFCKESNEIDTALALGQYVDFKWPKQTTVAF